MKRKDFVCLRCGLQAKGAPNHCPNCLWSQHISGKKGTACKGLMAPVGIVLGEEACMLTHRCVKCGHTHSQKSSVNDSFEAIARLSITQNEVHDEEVTIHEVLSQSVGVSPGIARPSAQH